MADMEKQQQAAYDYTCPMCHALIGELCTYGPYAEARDLPHGERRELADAAVSCGTWSTCWRSRGWAKVRERRMSTVQTMETKAALVAVGLLQCAEVNCDNVRALGPAGVQVVKMQIQQAIKVLGGELATEDVERSPSRRAYTGSSFSHSL